MLPAFLVGVSLLAANPPEARRADLAEYQQRRDGVGRDAKAHVALALWCEENSLAAERLKHLALAVLIEPGNATARGLLGLVAFGGGWRSPEAVSARVRADEDLARRLAEYNARRARTPHTADGQWALAIWCQKEGLDAEARAHFTSVTMLDPAREAAWKRLGCKKRGGRWLSDAEIAAEKEEAAAQKKADQYWKPLLMKWRGRLGDMNKRDEAEATLAKVDDPRATGAVWLVFVAEQAGHHGRAVQILGQIDSAASSRALAFLAVFDDSAEVRRAATETLRRRDPREFGGLLVGLLEKPIKYRVMPVGGPGSPGALFIEGRQVDVQRMYAPPSMPFVPVGLNDWVDYDDNGLPFITQRRISVTSRRDLNGVHNVLSLSQFERFNPADPALAASVAHYRANAGFEWEDFWRTHPMNRALLHKNRGAESRRLGVGITQGVETVTTTFRDTRIPVGQMMVEYQKSALAAQQQLERDVAVLDSRNDQIKQLNGRIESVLGDVTGRERGGDAESWRAWWVDLQGYAYTAPPEAPRPTVVEDVPLVYTPQAVPLFSSTRETSRKHAVGPPVVAPYSSMPSCFGAGTSVRTLDGSRAIESIRVGDRVLTQDVKTGTLGYHPVTVIHHNPPSPTFLVKLGGDTIVSSPFHRFWVVGKGWIMARDLRGGENLRLLGGPACVESVEPGPVQPVFNLDVADAHDFFAGAAAALVHDNTLPETRLETFDGARKLAAISTD